MLDQQEPVQDPQIDEVEADVEAEVQDAKSSDMPLWVWIVGGVVAIAAIVLIICGANGVFSADSDAGKLTKEQAEAAKRSNQNETSVDGIQERPEGVVESKPLETTGKEPVSTEATESSVWTIANAAKALATAVPVWGISKWWESSSLAAKEAKLAELYPVDPTNPIQIPFEKACGQSFASDSILKEVELEGLANFDCEDIVYPKKGGNPNPSQESPGFMGALSDYASPANLALGALAVLGVAAYGTYVGWCSKNTATGTVKKERNFTFSGDAVTVEELSEEDARHALNGPTGLTFEEDTTYVRITTEAGQSRVVLKEDPLLVAAVPTVPGQQRMITAGATDDTDGKDDSAKSGDSQRNQPTTEGEGSAPSGAHTPIRTQTSLASTLSNQSGDATPSAGAPDLVDAVLSNASNPSGHSSGNVTGIAGAAQSQAGDAFVAPPADDDQKSVSENSHPSRRVSGGQPIATGLLPEDGVEGPPGRVNTIFSSGVPAFGDALSTHSQNSENRPVVSPRPAQGLLHQHTMGFQGVDAPRAPQAEEGSVVWRSGNYYQVENDGQSLTQIGGKPARMEALVLSQEDMEHMLRADRTTDYPHRTNGQTYTFAGVKVRVQKGEAINSGSCLRCSSSKAPDTYHVMVTPVAEELSISGTKVQDGQDHGQDQEPIEINIAEFMLSTCEV